MPKAIEDSLDNVPEELKSYYVQKGEKFEFSGIDGIRTQADVDRLTEALRKERTDHGGLKDKFRQFEGLDANEVRQKLDRIAELEEIAKGKGVDDEQIQRLVAAKLNSTTAPLLREKDKLAADLAAALETTGALASKLKVRDIRDAVLSVVTGAESKLKLVSTAIDDVLMYAERHLDVDEDGRVVSRDGVGVTPGVSAEVWLQEMVQKRPHWAISEGGGASGSGGSRYAGASNPFSKDGWNMTEQGALLRSDPKKAEQMARAAGTTIGGPRPLK